MKLAKLLDNLKILSTYRPFGHAVFVTLPFKWIGIAPLFSFCVCVGVGGPSRLSAFAQSADYPISSKVADPHLKDASEKEPKVFENVTVQEKLGNLIDLTLEFTNESGEKKRLGDFVDGIHPVIFTLNYYSCRTLCSLQLGAFAKSLSTLDASKRKNMRIVTVSIDPGDTPADALKRKQEFFSEMEGDKPSWSFLIGDQNSVSRLADSLGFQYRYDPETKQFAHTAAIFFVSPVGKIVRYLYGLEYSMRDVGFALIDASEGKLGSSLEKLILRCFHYDSGNGKYTPFAFQAVRTGGVVTVTLLGSLLWFLWRREKMRFV